MKEHIYLDNAATTRVSVPCAKAAYDAMTVCWGNPSSRHKMGMEAENLIKSAKSALSAQLGCREDEIYFTSGGTEANNLAVIGGAEAGRRKGSRIIISSVEHSSVEESAAFLQTQGYDVVRISPRSDGLIYCSDIEEQLTDDTILLSFMLVNNETGAIFPVAETARMLKRRKSTALLHCDAVQAFGKLPTKIRELGCDMLSLSGHKIHAPKGVGALYIKKGVKLRPRTYGGSQQDKLRPGTEPVPLIAALGEAVRQLDAKNTEHTRQLNAYLRDRLAGVDIASLAHITINSPLNGAPHILSFATGCIKSETLLNFLSSKGIYVSSGSACAKGKASRVLTALSLPHDIADSTVRVSFCEDNTKDDIDALCEALKEALSTLARFK